VVHVLDELLHGLARPGRDERAHARGPWWRARAV